MYRNVYSWLKTPFFTHLHHPNHLYNLFPPFFSFLFLSFPTNRCAHFTIDETGLCVAQYRSVVRIFLVLLFMLLLSLHTSGRNEKETKNWCKKKKCRPFWSPSCSQLGLSLFFWRLYHAILLLEYNLIKIGCLEIYMYLIIAIKVYKAHTPSVKSLFTEILRGNVGIKSKFIGKPWHWWTIFTPQVWLKCKKQGFKHIQLQI